MRFASVMRVFLIAGVTLFVVGAGVGGAGPGDGPAGQDSPPAAPPIGARLVEGHAAFVVLETGSASSP